METKIANSTVELVTGDITQQQTDVIVNAANSQLAGGGGVDGAIHRTGGPAIMAETRQEYPQGCPTGDAVITGAGNLAARHVVHTVGPIWGGGERGEEEKLASAYRRSLEVVVENGCGSVAFPSLSTGAYRYPMDLAARTALNTVLTFLEERGKPELVRFVLFDQTTYIAYSTVLQEILAQREKG
ncbi:O-acetyl-ADP-ribose deacetylase [Acidobacteria bacterium AH-259-D05]|nr:O-acetyl-ADP-ribose deacetylase [Acidobacteria bacterium AH-259-D05]